MKKYKNLIFIVLIYISILAIWQLMYYILADKLSVVKSYIFPTPIGVIQSSYRLFVNNNLFSEIISSFSKMLIGFGLSIGIGLILGLLISRYKLVSKAIKPLILGLQTLPSICWIPFSILWFGLKDSATIFVIIIGSTFSIAISVYSAITNINPIYIKSAKTMGAKGKTLYLKVIFPASIPQFVSGLKQGWSFAWRALMAGEIISGTSGLGYVLLVGRELLDINQVLSVMIIIIIISIIIEKLFFEKAEKFTNKKMGLS